LGAAKTARANDGKLPTKSGTHCLLNRQQAENTIMAYLTKLHEAEAEIAAPNSDPWRLPLERVRGKAGDDGIERVTTQMLFDILDVPQRSRGAGACRRLAKIMAELGWTAVRVRDLTRGGYLEQVRGYARDARRHSAASN
ncbi:MAG: hypothetical protein WCF80_13300, partial [Pseudolabrys sp.]